VDIRDLIERAKYAASENTKQTILGVVAGVLLLSASVLLARMLFRPGPESAPVAGLVRRASAEDLNRIDQAKLDREKDEEALRLEAAALGEDLTLNPREAR
jgi:hypothetical protein